jgi:murein DD-endopeptidase MepM/ murein hydrolase activator NlpD
MMRALIQINTAEARCQADPNMQVATVRIDSARLPASVGAFHDDQVVNAAIVLSAGYELEVPERAMAIAVMTAMGESGLRVFDEGESLGPDNAGLFQQGSGSAWGSHEDRVDPAISSANFYEALLAVDGWEDMEPAEAANAVQRGADGESYGDYWDDALEMVRELSQGAVTVSVKPCVTEYGVLGGGSGTWVSPVAGRITSAFGYRVHPVLGIAGAHTGTDVAAKCGTPVRAAADGIVVWSGGGIQGRTGNQVIIYHGDGQLTRYGHLLTGTVLVSVGDTVKAGDRIASVGGNPRLDPIGAGNSTGCHVHFETNTNNGSTAVNPVIFLREHGVKLGAR